MKKKYTIEFDPLLQKAYDFREANKDIPNIAELCIYFGIEREDLVKELRILLGLEEA